ncbi:MAG: ThuA domain-containing protein [bacterium]|nr:ThuA domain-containing protein [bacterium]
MNENGDWLMKPLRLVHYFCTGVDQKDGIYETLLDERLAERFAEDMAALNVNAIHFDGRGQLLRDVCRLMHDRNIKVFAYHTPFVGKEADRIWEDLDSHPEWNSVAAEQALSEEKPLPGSHKCCNTGFREFTYAVMKKTVQDYDVDGIFFDGYAIPPGHCYCQRCQEKFRQQYGEDIPTEADETSIAWKTFKQFRYEQVAEFIKGCREAVKEGNPEAVFYMNMQGLHRLSWCTARNGLMLKEAVDIVGSEAFEYYYPESLRNRALWAQGATAKLNTAVAGGKPAVVFCTLTPRPWGKRALPGATLRNMTAQVMAHGAGIWYESSYYTYMNSMEETGELSKALEFFRENEAYYAQAKSSAAVALLWSTRNGDYYAVDPAETSDWTLAGEKGGKEGRNVYLSAWRGMYDILLRAHIPFDIITDEDLTVERLKRYKTIVTANAPVMSDDQCAALRSYVFEGGGLVCSYETSLYDEWGNKRSDFELKDVIGAGVVAGKDFGNLWKEYNHFTLIKTEHPVARGVRKSMPSPTFALAVQAGRDEEVLSIVDMTKAPAEDKGIRYPAVIARQYGQGRVVYSAGCLEERYWRANFPEIKELIKNSIVWTGGDCLPIKIEAPETVEVTLSRQADEKRYILHFINYTGEMARPLNNIIPINDIQVILEGLELRKIKTVRTLVGKQEIPLKVIDGKPCFSLSRLDWYEAVVLE